MKIITIIIGIFIILIIVVAIFTYILNKKNISENEYDDNSLMILYNTDPASNAAHGYLSNTTFNTDLHVFVNDSTLEIRISDPNAIKVSDGYYIEQNGTYTVELYANGKLVRTFTVTIAKPLGPQYQINDDGTMTIIGGISKVEVEDMDFGDVTVYEGANLTGTIRLPYEMNEIRIYHLVDGIEKLYTVETKEVY